MTSRKKVHSHATIWYNEYGQYHNDAGPARIWHNGNIEYWLEDIPYSFEEWQRIVKLLVFK